MGSLQPVSTVDELGHDVAAKDVVQRSDDALAAKSNRYLARRRRFLRDGAGCKAANREERESEIFLHERNVNRPFDSR